MSVFINDIVQADHPAQATPATAESFAVGESEIAATVSEVSIIPSGALTASDAANRIFTLINRGTDGTGTTVIATLTTNIAGGSWVANDEILMILSGVTGARNVGIGDVLAINETLTGAGAAHPAFQISVRGPRQ